MQKVQVDRRKDDWFLADAKSMINWAMIDAVKKLNAGQPTEEVVEQLTRQVVRQTNSYWHRIPSINGIEFTEKHYA